MSELQSIISTYKIKCLQQQFIHVRKAIDLVKSLVQKQEHIKDTYVSFNGGKDATVVLFLTIFAYSELEIPLSEIKVLYFEQPNPFQEVDEFRDKIRQMIHLKQIKAERNFIKSLTELKTKYDIQYIIMGSRRTDPYCENLHDFSPSDVSKGYPAFVRVNPILDWTFQMVWNFLKSFELPYCSLYEQGYTYLGNKSNTTKNQQLNKGNGQYYPAWVAKQQNQCKSRYSR